MTLSISTRSLISLVLAALWSSVAMAQKDSGDVRAAIESNEIPAAVNTVPVTLHDFPRAETHHMMQVAIDAFDCLGEWSHLRGFTPIEKQNVVRMNRDTLYSSLVLDLSTPVVLTKSDTGDRYQSILVVNEDHFARKVFYEPGEYRLTKEDLGSRYVAVIARTLVDAEDPDDMARAHAAQDGLKLIQADKGRFEIPNWDQRSLEEMREALKILGRYLPSRDAAFGATIEEVDPVAYLIGSADAWGGWKPENAVYMNFTPARNDGMTPHVLTLKDVPSAPHAFWSISVYNREGYFQENEFDAYVINSREAETSADGSVSIHFGGDPSQPNFLPIVGGWNYMLRIYLPQESYFDGSWAPPEATPIDQN